MMTACTWLHKAVSSYSRARSKNLTRLPNPLSWILFPITWPERNEIRIKSSQRSLAMCCCFRSIPVKVRGSKFEKPNSEGSKVSPAQCVKMNLWEDQHQIGHWERLAEKEMRMAVAGFTIVNLRSTYSCKLCEACFMFGKQCVHTQRFVLRFGQKNTHPSESLQSKWWVNAETKNKCMMHCQIQEHNNNKSLSGLIWVIYWGEPNSFSFTIETARNLQLLAHWKKQRTRNAFFHVFIWSIDKYNHSGFPKLKIHR